MPNKKEIEERVSLMLMNLNDFLNSNEFKDLPAKKARIEQALIDVKNLEDVKEKVEVRRMELAQKWDDAKQELGSLFGGEEEEKKLDADWLPQPQDFRQMSIKEKKITIVAGIQKFVATLPTLKKCPESKLTKAVENYLEGPKKPALVLDRKSEPFKNMLHYLRDNFRLPELTAEQSLAAITEIRYWKLPWLPTEQLDELNGVFSSDPRLYYKLGQPAVDKWKMMGPLRVEDIFMKSKYTEMRQVQMARKSWNNGVYIGQLRDDNKQAFGICRKVFSNSISEGYFEQEQGCNWSRTIWSDGDYYIGHWKNGEMHGDGMKVHADGQVQDGVWNEGVFIGEMGELGEE